MKILFIDTAHPVLQKLFEENGNICDDGSKQSREEILKNISHYEGIIIRSRIRLDKEILDAAIKLKFVARAGAGMESIDVSYAESKGIVCLNSPEGSRDAVGEHAIAMLLALFNKLNKTDREVREGKWIREGNRGTELHGKTVGIIGYGNMGSSFAKKLSGFECNVIAYDKYKNNFSDAYVTEVSLEKIFDDADVLSLHVPLTDETEFMVDDVFIQHFKKNIYIINVARGRVVKTDDLVKNIKTGKVAGACLDVNEYEDSSFEKSGIQNPKPPKASLAESGSEIPESWKYLIGSDKAIFSPHIAGWTYESNEKIANVLFEKIKKLF
jgi:D-3-phosphoglycerate dehydrogenase